RAPRARLLLRRDRRARRARDRADEVDPARVLVEADAGPRAPSPDAIAGLAEYRARGRVDLGVRIAPRAADRQVRIEDLPAVLFEKKRAGRPIERAAVGRRDPQLLRQRARAPRRIVRREIGVRAVEVEREESVGLEIRRRRAEQEALAL